MYGAALVAARYCSIGDSPGPLPGIWQHGAIDRRRNFHPAAVIGGARDYEEVKSTEKFWVARRDQELFLRSRGYAHVKAIGLPVVYLTRNMERRRRNSLLLMPVHTLPATVCDTASGEFAEYLEIVLRFRDRFDLIAMCLHKSCLDKGLWIEECRQARIPVVRGADPNDYNALYRMQALFEQFEFVTSNGFGSHLIYAAYFGAKPSIYGPEARVERRHYSNELLYRECPEILDPILRLMERGSIARTHPFLCIEPDRAEAQVRWGEDLVGHENRVSPREMIRLFKWGRVRRVERKLAQMTRRIRRFVPGRVSLCLRMAVDPQFRRHELEVRRIFRTPRFHQGTATVLDKPLRFVDGGTFLFQHREIIERAVYRFVTLKERPRILDVGANIGVSVVYFKSLYPQCRLTAFEADPRLAAVLRENCSNRALDDVEVIAKAAWVGSGPIQFQADETDAGRITDSRGGSGSIEVPAVRLRDWLEEEVAMLKMDIEGAETDVLLDCADRLDRVENLFVEYHDFVGRPQRLHELLGLLIKSGFRITLLTEMEPPQPLFHRPVYKGMDFQVSIAGIRE